MVMKRITGISLFIMASFITVGSALAQDRAVQASVPFDFIVGKTALPAGTYTITPVFDNVIMIQNKDSRIAIMSLALQDSRESQNRSELVFDKTSSQYFLTSIRCPYTEVNVDLPPSKLEKRAQRQEAELHGNSNGSEQVLVALK
jgi:hypothetical protein